MKFRSNSFLIQNFVSAIYLCSLSQTLIRSRSLRENGKYLPKQAFLTRRHFFNNEETGILKTQQRNVAQPNPMTDPSMMTEMLKGNLTNVLPMIVIGGWINWHFSGFVTTKGWMSSLVEFVIFKAPFDSI